jgi:hypothetical protein|tara:strand:- start:14719 stop:14913 length:195 start_codon:yes stop_codon:yes gene_type:complete
MKNNNKNYKGYLLGDLPNKFGYIKKESLNEDGETEEELGIKSWFNYKGLTYLEKKKSIWDYGRK